MKMYSLRKATFATLVVLGCSAETTSPLLTQYDKLRVHTALLAPSSGVDEMPLWSPDSKVLAVNVEGKWYQIDTENVLLDRADWHKKHIGRIGSRHAISPLDTANIERWQKATLSNSTAIVDRAGNKFEFVRKDLRTRFVVTAKGRKPVLLWTSYAENCGELSLSPDGHWIAFICEQNGVLVTSVDRVVPRK